MNIRNTKPVVIEIEDRRNFAEVAFLVDKDEFLTDLEEKRRELKIEKVLPYADVEKWIEAEIDHAVKKQPVKVWKNEDSKTIRYSIPKIKSELIIESLLQKYHRDENFFIAIEYALLCGKVTEKEFSSAYCSIIYPDTLSKPKLAIVISPDTKWDEIKSIYDKKVPELAAKYNNKILKSDRVAPDTISNIKRDREWYWLHHKNGGGLSYGDIQKQWSLKNEHISRDAVIHAIKRYENNLSVDI